MFRRVKAIHGKEVGEADHWSASLETKVSKINGGDSRRELAWLFIVPNCHILKTAVVDHHIDGVVNTLALRRSDLQLRLLNFGNTRLSLA
jgi:hypothetical protein